MKIYRRASLRVPRLLAVSAAAITMVLAWALPAQAAPSGTTICAGGQLAGDYGSLVVTGECDVVAPVVVNGDLTVTGKAAVFFSEYPNSPSVTINGDVSVKRGGLLAFGQPIEGCGYDVQSTSVINGNVVARGALSLKILCSTVNGDVVSTGGGYNAPPDCLINGGTNMPLKDNVILGSLTVQGWSGCWLGVIRSQVGGNVTLKGNTSAAVEPGTTNLDGMEIVTNRIEGNLVCHGNRPDPQIGDSMGDTNQVGGHKVGQCASL